jgi:hypothetical protein
MRYRASWVEPAAAALAGEEPGRFTVRDFATVDHEVIVVLRRTSNQVGEPRSAVVLKPACSRLELTVRRNRRQATAERRCRQYWSQQTRRA